MKENNQEQQDRKDTKKGLFTRVLQGTHAYFSCYLPARIGFLSSLILKLIFSGIQMDDKQKQKIKNLPDDAIIVYCGKYKSKFEFLFFHTRMREDGLVPPVVGMDYRIFFLQPLLRLFRIILAHTHYFFTHWKVQNPYKQGYVKEEMLESDAGFMSLVEHRGFYRRFVKERTDPLRYLIEMQKTTNRPVILVPQIIFFSRKPHKSKPTLVDMVFGTMERPGMLRRLFTLVKNPGKVFVEISQPVNLKLRLEKEKYQKMDDTVHALVLRRELLNQINRHRQTITGPMLKMREELKENILTNDRLRKFMKKHARENDLSIYKVNKEADEYLEEIASKFSFAWIEVFRFVLKRMFGTLFEGITVNWETLDRVKAMSEKGPLILCPCHKSHIDYLILSYVLYHYNMPPPHIAAGKNLSFWPLGPIFRGGGAFFIRRTFKGQPLYAKVFSEYVYKLLEEGYHVEFFIEGGRSRTGKLLSPKYGFLSILIDTFEKGSCEDLIFAPVYIGYDRVLEESAYLHELEGGKKEPENLSQMFRARKVFKKRYGKIYIQFHEPIAFSDYLMDWENPISEMTEDEKTEMISKLGYKLLNSIDRVTVVTPHAVVAAAILNGAKHRFSYSQVKKDVETYMDYLYFMNASLSDTLLTDAGHAVEIVFESYVQQKLIEQIPTIENQPETDIQYLINPSRRPVLDYYKNNGIVYYIPAAFTALSILRVDAFQFGMADLYESYRFMRRFFNNEFAYDVDQSSEYYVRKAVKAFVEAAILIPHPNLPETFNLTSSGFRKLKLFAGFLKTYFESYWIVLNVFRLYPQEFIEKKDLLKKIHSMGYRMYKRKEIGCREAVSRINFKNAIKYYTAHGVHGSDDAEKIDYYVNTLKDYMKYLPSTGT